MIVLGLTGSIGMGKSTAAGMLRRLGLAVFDADGAVHRLLGPGGGAVGPVTTVFAGVASSAGGIDRQRLGREVFGQPAALRRLERIVHPLVAAEERRFLARGRARRLPIAVLDIPLLLEGGGERRCDAVIVVSAPAWVQRERVIGRPGMTEARYRAILHRQMPDAEKRRRADFVVPTGLGRALTLRRLRAIVRIVQAPGWRRCRRPRTAVRPRRAGT